VLLILLVGVAGGAVLTTVAGARRSATAYERFRDETFAADLDMAFADGDVPPPDLAEAEPMVRSIPEVVALGHLDFPFLVPAGSGFYPYLDFLAAGGADAPDIDVPRVLEGRLPDPRKELEVAILEIYARESGLEVGDRAEFESYRSDQLEPLFTTGDAGPPAGPRFTFVVTAIFDAPTFLSESTGNFAPKLFVTPAFMEAHAGDVATYAGGFSIRLAGGAADEAPVTKELREMFPDNPLEITPSSEIDRKIDSSIDVIVTALALCALVAGLAGAVAVAQALARHFGTQATSDRWLAALGMTRSERVASQAVSILPVAVIGAGLAVAVAVLASPLMPVGVARRAEPDPGISVDGPVLMLGSLVVALAVLLLASVAALTVARRARLAAGAGEPVGPSRAMRAIRRTNLPPAATTGLGMALEPRGGTSWAVRSALLGVVLGALGLVAVAVFLDSIDTLVRSPARYGAPFDAVVSGFSGDVLAEGGEELLEDPDVARAGLGLGGLARIDGDDVNSYVLESLKGDMTLTLLTGHEPRGRAEVVLGSATLDRAGVGIGDEVDIDGAASSLRATVVGTAAFPVLDERGAPDRGVLLGRDDFDAISSLDEVNEDVLIDWADGVDVTAANQGLAESTGTEIFEARLPSDVNNLREVKALPRALAAFLAVLALLAAVHALVSTVRMRQQELAVLRTLGFDRRQLGSTLAWEATAIGVVGLVVGVPLGLVVGRVVWRAVAGGIGVVDAPETPLLAMAVVIVAALVVLVAASVLPGRSARSISAAAVLRSA
jgi:hypothetical protein